MYPTIKLMTIRVCEIKRGVMTTAGKECNIPEYRKNYDYTERRVEIERRVQRGDYRRRNEYMTDKYLTDDYERDEYKREKSEEETSKGE